MKDILNSFVAVAPYINKLTNSDFAVSVCDLKRCLIYVPSDKQDHKIRSGDSHIEDSVAYESVLKKKRIVKRVGSEVFGFPYIAIAIPIEDHNGNVVGAVSFTEAVDKQDLLLALADNLHDTMKQMTSITEVISENSLRLKEVGENLGLISKKAMENLEKGEDLLDFTNKININLEELLSISSEQIEISTYISSLVNEVNHRTVKLRESAKDLSE